MIRIFYNDFRLSTSNRKWRVFPKLGVDFQCFIYFFRIASFVAADKAAKEAAKRAKKEEVKKYKEEQARIAREEEERKKAEEEAEKKRLADIEAEKKKIAKAEANACKKERKKLRQTAKGF